MTADTLEQGRQAFARGAWTEAFTCLQSAEAAEDLERLATAACLIGRDAERDGAMEGAHRAFLDQGDIAAAGRCAFWLGIWLLNGGETARGGGWLSRAQRVTGDLDCVVQGYLLIPQALQEIVTDPAAGYERFATAMAIGGKFDDTDLVALGRLGQGQALMRLGETRRSTALLDEVMVAVQAGEVSPIPSGIIYCAVISLYFEIADLNRAHEWTAALSRWCAAQPDMVPFRGECLVHRSQVLQLRGEWRAAMQEARRACVLYPAGHPAVGAAHYQRAELHRVRGELEEAERAYREASRWGHDPQPGLAQLRLAQGDVGAARAAIGRALGEARDVVTRSRLLPVAVEAALAGGDAAGARAGVDELVRVAAEVGTPLLQNLAAHLEGTLLLVEGDAHAAAGVLRRAARGWGDLNVPYESARARALTGWACRDLGDADGADMELAAADRVLTELGAPGELARLQRLTDAAVLSTPGGLTQREIEVLRLVAAGKSNQTIADELVLSPHTVARHVQNIFSKLDVSSRTAAAAYAFAHDLV